MVKKVCTYVNYGLEAHEITIEGDMNKSLPTIEIIGLPDASIKESKERVRATFRNCGVQLPQQKIILNLAPSYLKKGGTRFDVSIAMTILGLLYPKSKNLSDILNKSIFFGELGLDGSIRGIMGLLPSILTAKQNGRGLFFIPKDNVEEIRMISGISIYGVSHFNELLGIIDGLLPDEIVGSSDTIKTATRGKITLSHIKGHKTIKRALCIATAGLHNILLIGPPGSGKTMLARATKDLLPELSFEEMLEVNKIYSVAGEITDGGMVIKKRPFRRVHHTASKISLVGGGTTMRPGQVSLSHLGVLFLDEFPEFGRETLEVLRQPIEDKEVTISRAHGTVKYPASFMLVAAMNPCKCGYYMDPSQKCKCTQKEIMRYQSKISGPLLDRFDMIIEVPREELGVVLSGGDIDIDYGCLVDKARIIQENRYRHTKRGLNGQTQNDKIDVYINLNSTVKEFLKESLEKLGLSPRVAHRTMKVARTIADIDGAIIIERKHIAEALYYRSRSMFL